MVKQPTVNHPPALRSAIRRIGISLLALAVGGCALPTVRVNTHPPGAKFYIEETFVGVTPLTYSIRPEGPESPIHYTLQKDGYVTATGFLTVHASHGRVVGAIFTFGILAAFAQMNVVTPEELELGLIPAVAVDPIHGNKETTEERINALKRLRDAGDITPVEYERYKTKALGGD